MSVPRLFEFFYYFFLNFFIFYFYFLNFLEKIKKIATCQAVIVPRGSDSDTCQYYFLSLNLVPLF